MSYFTGTSRNEYSYHLYQLRFLSAMFS